MKQKSDSRLSLSEGGDPPPPPSPPSRHEKWKLARLRSSGSSTSDIVERYQKELLSKEYEQKLKEEITKKVRAELYDEIVEMVARQFQQRYDDYGNRPPPSPVAEHVVPPTSKLNNHFCLLIYFLYNLTFNLTSRSGKGSCSVAGAPGDDMDDTRPCQLYILFDTGTMLVARGTVYETVIVVHGVQLAEDEVKVTVDEVVVPDVVLLVPTDEFFTVQEPFKSFVAWLRHLVGDVSDPPQTCQEGSPTPKKTHLFENDPLGALDELANIISYAPMSVHWDSTTFEREAQIPLYLHQQDVRELTSGREEINITLIQL
ncbi:hypothetical protein LR48_Vigan05g131000 [Vigna angularis]|uniref:DUF8039 domain-containing protein n=1 Tax=Phaseolus angularis TaxID=3914 RepID=A0A0L9ULC5_PHAAN|nr:hypothetical protein LR48_Vigan05g131000 [Vigna angularis]